jgi:hypothetical protein
LLLLDVYWNIVTWRPEWDGTATFLLVWIAAATAGCYWMARASRDRLTRVVSLLICMALLALGIYVSRAEPLSFGMFGRESCSPLWYRAGRLLVLGTPTLLWCLTFEL